MATTLSPGIQYVGSSLQYVSPTGQILPVSAAPSTPSSSGTTNNATVPTPSQVTFNPAALPPKLSPGIQYVGSQLQYVSPTGQILPVSAAPSTPSGSSTTDPYAAAKSALDASNADLSNTLNGIDATISDLTSTASDSEAAAPNELTSVVNEQSAPDIYSTGLAAIGITDPALAAQVALMVKQGINWNGIMTYIRATPTYAARFPAMAGIIASGHPITEAEYLTKETADRNLLYQYLGDSAKAYDNPAQLGMLMTNTVSTATLQTRLQSIHDIVNASPDTQAWLKSNYGLSAQDLAAAWLDPNTTADMVAKRDAMAQIGGAGITSGFGNISQAQAETLANQGISQSQAQSGFTNLAQEKQFGIQLPGESGKALNQDQLISSQFGTNGNDVTALKNIQQSRINEFNAGGAIQADQSGVKGIGASNLTA